MAKRVELGGQPLRTLAFYQEACSCHEARPEKEGAVRRGITCPDTGGDMIMTSIALLSQLQVHYYLCSDNLVARVDYCL